MSETPTKFTVIDVRDLPSADPARMGKWDKIVVYEVDPEHRYSVAAPAETFSEETLRTAVKADMQGRAKWVGKTFQA